MRGWRLILVLGVSTSTTSTACCFRPSWIYPSVGNRYFVVPTTSQDVVFHFKGHQNCPSNKNGLANTNSSIKPFKDTLFHCSTNHGCVFLFRPQNPLRLLPFTAFLKHALQASPATGRSQHNIKHDRVMEKAMCPIFGVLDIKTDAGELRKRRWSFPPDAPPRSGLVWRICQRQSDSGARAPVDCRRQRRGPAAGQRRKTHAPASC